MRGRGPEGRCAAAIGVACLAAGLAGVPLPAAAEDPPPASTDPGWAPPEPSDSDADWVQLVSGEWLKGDFEGMRDRVVSFDSEELDDLQIDFEDVARFRLMRGHSYRTESREIHRGTGEMRDGRVRVRTPDGVVEFGRDELISIVQGEGRELDRWSTKLILGLAARQGNTDQADLTGTTQLRRESALTRWTLDYNGVISTVNDEKTANSHRGSTALDVYLTQRFYVRAPFLEFFTDEFQNIDQRYTPGAGLGYEFVRRRWLEWDGNLGAAYQYTLFTTGDDASDLAVLLGTELDFDFRAFDWDNLYQLQLVPTDPGRTSHHFESIVSFDLWGPLDLDVSFVWDRIARPRPDAEGVRPKSDDVRLSVGVGLDF